VLGLITLVGRLVQERIAALLEDMDLTYAQAVTLVRLWRTDGGAMRQSDLIDSLAVSRSAGTQVLNDLAERGFVERVADPSDARMLVVRLTEGGRRIEGDVVRIFDQAEEESVAALDREERAELMRTMGRMLEAARRQRGTT
jgi:DNA-binding MarR family transcriptional regulator